MNQEKIGKFIFQMRKNKKITQKDLAEKLNVSDRTIGNWENGRNMPDLSLFKPLCEELDISINDLLSGEIVKEKEYQEKLEENIINTIDYSNKKLENRNNLIGLLIIVFGILISITAIAVFPSDSSWGSIYSVIGVIISLIGVSRFTKKFKPLKRVICNYSYFIILILLLIFIDFLGVMNIKQAPRFSITKNYGENMVYYDTLFYDVIRCNVDEENEKYIIIKNHNYDETYNNYCK